MKRYFAFAGLAAIALQTHPAFATLSSTGSVDPSSMLVTLVGYILGLVGLAFICVFAFKGIQCATDGRHFGPAAAALIGGVLLCYGGYYILTKIGVS